MRPCRDGDGGKLVFSGAMIVAMAARNHGVARNHAEPAKHGIIPPGFFIRLACAGARVVGKGDECNFALTRLDGHRCERDHRYIRRAALIPDASDARLQAHRFC